MKSIEKILDEVESNEIVLPEFQREFVWRKNQTKNLIESLYKGYPIGSFTIWVTQEPPKIKNDAIDREDYASFKVLLDGQQRLTVLYLLTKDKIPPYYDEEDIQNDPRDLYFNLMNGKFRYEDSTIKEDSEWIKLTEIFKDELNIIDILNKNIGTKRVEKASGKAKIYAQHKGKVESILKQFLPVQELSQSAELNQAIELFERINSEGTKLADADLTLAYMTAQWDDIRREIKDFQFKMAEKGFKFGLRFYVKCLVSVLTGEMIYEKANNTPKERLMEKWEDIKDILGFITNFLKNEAHMPNSSYLSNLSILIPFVAYLDEKDRKLTRNEKNDFLKWIYTALIWSRYDHSTNKKLEKDLSLLKIGKQPTKELVKEVKRENGRIEVRPFDLDGVDESDQGLYNMVKIIIRANGPVDWKTGESFSGDFELFSHHIFPKSKLQEELYLGKKRVDEIGNMVFLPSKDNLEIFEGLPENFLHKINDEYPETLKSQFIPDNPELWELKNYEEFLKKRRKMIADGINDFIDSIGSKPEKKKGERILELIKRGENDRIEFKETIKYDVYQDQANTELTDDAVKEIAAFANSNGGTLIIGVEDEDKEIKGIKRDIEIINSKDNFELQLNQAIADKLSESFASMYTQLEFVEFNDKELCVVSVDSSPDPVYYGNDREFFVRRGSSSVPLNTEETIKYIEENFR